MRSADSCQRSRFTQEQLAILTDTVLPRTYLELLVETLDIPPSLYERAVARHHSLGEWLGRDASRLRQFNPRVSPQGSFRHGTVVRPLVQNAEYDLDTVTTLHISKAAITQKDLKQVYGLEMRDYAQAHGMLAPPEEKNRCWRLRYADQETFHLDSLPSLAEEEGVIISLRARNVPEEFAKRAIAITDKRHPAYATVTTGWPTSNPRGFARWLEAQMGTIAQAKRLDLVERRIYASVEGVPTYALKTPLQRAIQLLKRHRDVMFADDPEVAPISMILTNLSGRAYGGEADVYLAVRGILSRMLDFVRPETPYVPNPTHPAEDYADKWSKDRRLELNFRLWHAQASRDFEQLLLMTDAVSLRTATRQSFRVDLSDDHLKRLGLPSSPSPAIITSAAPAVRSSSAPRPWGTAQ
jgi:hypothetical protein